MLYLIKYTPNKTVSGWLLALALVAGFFSGYARNFTAEPRPKIQTEWVAIQRNLRTSTFRITGNNSIGWAHSELSFILFQNRVTQIQFTAHPKRHSPVTSAYFVQAKHLPQDAIEDLIAS